MCSVKVIKNPKNEKRVHSFVERTTKIFFNLKWIYRNMMIVP